MPADLAATALPWAEIALAVLLLLSPAGWLVPVAAALVLLMLSYTWIVARALGFDEPVTCSCFGSLGRHDIDRTTLGRNVLLVVLAAALLWFAVDGGSVLSAFADLDVDGVLALVASVASAVVAVLVLGGPGTAAAPAANEGELLDYERQSIPYGVLTLADGRSATLNELAAQQAKLLLVVNPRCGPCLRTAEKVDGWAAQLQPAVGMLVVYPDAASAASATEHAPELGAHEPELNVRRLFSVTTPGAVLLGADGFLAGGPVYGADGVADFVADVLDALAEEPAPAE